MFSHLLEAFLLGLSTGPMCLAYCAPVLAPFIVADKKYNISSKVGLLSLFLLGRLAGYIAIGLITGLMGNAISKYENSSLIAVATIMMGAMLFIFGFLKIFPEVKLCRLWPGGNSTTIWALVLGLLTGLNICPPFLAAITGSVALGTVQGSMFYFIAFFVGTSLYILPIVLLGPLSKIESVRNVAQICLILSGIWFIVKGIIMLCSTPGAVFPI